MAHTVIFKAMGMVLKSFDYYGDKIKQYVRDLYNAKIDQATFEDRMGSLIENQLRRAWNDGMRENGLDPRKDMTDALESKLQDAILKEYDYIRGFGDAVIGSRGNEAGYGALYSRAELWQNRYTDITNQAVIESAKKEDYYRWDYGDTIDHCSDCSSMQGQIKTMKEWVNGGILPQSSELECNGFRCGCSLNLVDGPGG